MNNAQKVIKYVAMVVAIWLTILIITGILTAVGAIFGITALMDFANSNVETMDYIKEYPSIYSIEMDVAATELEIKKGEIVKVEGTTIPTDYKFEEENGTLKIKNKRVNNDSKLVIYVPENMSKLDVDIGAGKIVIGDIKVKDLILDTGAAASSIKNLIVTSNADVDAGIGEIVIENSDISNLDLDAGVGNVEYNGYLRGTNEVNCGVGNVAIKLLGTKEMYKIMAERGIGELKINGNKLSGTQTLGEGINVLKISGGIGSLRVTY